MIERLKAAMPVVVTSCLLSCVSLNFLYCIGWQQVETWSGGLYMNQPPNSSGPYSGADPYGSQQAYGGAPRSGPGSYAPSYSAYNPVNAAAAPRGEPIKIFNPAQAQPRTGAPGGNFQQQGQGSGGYSSQAPQGPMSDFVGYDAFTSAANSQAVKFGMNMGQQVINENVKRYVPWITGLWQSLKYYFAVNNTYVRKKLLILLFPYRKKQWSREVKDDGSMGEGTGGGLKYQLPMIDENAPDLYIPLMAFITYVLVTGYAKGTSSSFTPEVLVQVTSSCLVAQILEIAVICLGLYMLQAPVNFLDLVAFTGYKYVALNINMILGITMGTAVYTVAMLYTGLSISYFVLKSIAQAVKRGYHVPTGGPIRPEFVILGFAGLQFLSVWWLGYAGDLK